jgi:hypothetical protein
MLDAQNSTPRQDEDDEDKDDEDDDDNKIKCSLCHNHYFPPAPQHHIPSCVLPLLFTPNPSNAVSISTIIPPPSHLQPVSRASTYLRLCAVHIDGPHLLSFSLTQRPHLTSRTMQRPSLGLLCYVSSELHALTRVPRRFTDASVHARSCGARAHKAAGSE